MDDAQVEVGLLSTRVKDSSCECAVTGGQKNTTAVNMLKFQSSEIWVYVLLRMTNSRQEERLRRQWGTIYSIPCRGLMK